MTDLLTLDEVLELLDARRDFVATLEREAIVTRTGDRFTLTQVDTIRVCWNLHHALGVNLAGIEVALRLLRRLEHQQDAHRAQLQHLLDLED